uniref:G_PROTEIN_RECEP_F1_2 domain-containing protein n=1 Tax=Steinernema glaseri TaxID=37863 RepID=A0A1I7Z2F3_9BILA
MEVLLPVSITIFVIGLLGVFGNVNIVWATYRRRDFQSKCVLSLNDLICIGFEWKNAIGLISAVENYRIPCFWAISVYLFMITFQSTMIPCMAFDRLFAIAWPFKYRVTRTTNYVTLLCAICSLNGLLFVLLGIVFPENNDRIAACNPPLAFPPLISYLWNKWIISLNILTLLLYIASFALLHRKRKQIQTISNSSTRGEHQHLLLQQKIMRTMSVIIILFVISWFYAHCQVFFSTLLGLDEQTAEIVMSTAVVPVMICYVQNYYVYLWRSSDYRAAFKEQLHCMTPSAVGNSRTVATTMSQVRYLLGSMGI